MDDIETWRRQVDTKLAEFPHMWKADIDARLSPMRESMQDIAHDVREMKEDQKMLTSLHEASMRKVGADERRESNLKKTGAMLMILGGAAGVGKIIWELVTKLIHNVTGR